MRRFIAQFLGIVLLAGVTGSPAASARGGEDWPFFCALRVGDDLVDGMRLVPDDDSPSGFGLQIFKGGVKVAYTYPSLSDSADNQFRVVYGIVSQIVKVGPFDWQDLQVLAYLAKTDKAQSWGDAQVAPQGEQGAFSKNPMACRAAIH